jgi:GT2 family glycosyltransferase
MPESALSDAVRALRVSAVILAYNQVAAARQTVSSLELSAPRESLEIILLDCGSRDGTQALDSEFPAVQMLRLPHHLGAARALNIGVRTARGDYVLLLAPGVQVAPDTAARLATALEEAGPGTAAICPRLVDEQGRPVAQFFRLPQPGARQYAPGEPDASGCVELASFDALMVRKQFIQAMNYFDQRYGHAWVEAELAMQIRRAGKKIRVEATTGVIRHPAPDPLAGDRVAEADRILGACAYAGKYGGSAIRLRWSAALGALARFDLGLFAALVSGQKLDGSQAH